MLSKHLLAVLCPSSHRPCTVFISPPLPLHCVHRTAPSSRHCSKPENFLLTSKRTDGELKLTDFGLGVFFKPGERFRDLVGSPYYVAPEVRESVDGGRGCTV
eukprot:364489-Chlamydomonas_euryale.AAC.7